MYLVIFRIENIKFQQKKSRIHNPLKISARSPPIEEKHQLRKKEIKKKFTRFKFDEKQEAKT